MPWKHNNTFNPKTVIDNEGVKVIKELQDNLPLVSNEISSADKEFITS